MTVLKQKTKLCGLVAGFLVTMIFSLPGVKAGESDNFSNNTVPIPQVLGAQSILVRGDSNQSGFEHVSTPVLSADLDTSGVRANSFLVFDAKTNLVLTERAADEKRSIASLTKLLTAYVAYKNMPFSSEVVVPNFTYTKIRPIAGLVANEKTTLSDLTTAMLVGSANDAAEAVGEVVEKKTNRPFIQLMNEEAKNLGMLNSHFSNPVGFDDVDHFSTARDVSMLVRALNDYTAFSLHGKMTAYDFKTQLRSHHVVATHKLSQRDEEVYAVKTGFTLEARGNMVSRISRGGNDIFVIVIGSPNRDADTELLKEAVFSAYTWNN